MNILKLQKLGKIHIPNSRSACMHAHTHTHTHVCIFQLCATNTADRSNVLEMYDA